MERHLHVSYFANINTTPCNLAPNLTEEQIIIIHVGESDDATNYGEPSCESGVGEPINVTNGNMYLQQTDYRLPGFGAGLDLAHLQQQDAARRSVWF